MKYDFLVEGTRLPDIRYRAEDPDETICPRLVMYEDSDTGVMCWHVYCHKKRVPLSRFLERLAQDEPGLRVGGYRPSNGEQTTISFNRRARVTISPRLKEILQGIRSSARASSTTPAPEPVSEPTSEAVPASAPTGPTSLDSGLPRGRGAPVTLEQLQARLAAQAATGLKGEHAAYRHEHIRLHALGCPNPAEHIIKVSDVDVAAGYDLLSDYNGETRHIEVKASRSRTDSFFISENERRVLTALGDEAYLYLVRVDEKDEKNSRVIREIRNPFQGEHAIELEPTAWLAKLTRNG